jgi:hypothetical protein
MLKAYDSASECSFTIKQDEALSRLNDIAETGKAHTQQALSRLGVDSDITTLRELSIKHPELVIGTATAVVALPSLLFGKRVAFRNILFTASAASLGTYGAAHWHWQQKGAKSYRSSSSNSSSSSDSR